MSNPLKKLAGQTAIYGLPSIVGRLLNYLLVPLHTAVFVPDQFGIITEMYSYVAFLIVILAAGMETAFFRFISRKDDDHKQIYSTIIIALTGLVALFVCVSVIFDTQVATWLQYPDNSEYVVWFAMIIGLDALSTLPMAKLRQEERAKKFAVVNIANIAVNIGLNLLFLGYIVPHGNAGESNWLVDLLYDKDIGVGYVFIANLVASFVKFMLLSPSLLKSNWKFDFGLLVRLFSYGAPMLIGNLAIIINEVLDKPMLKYMLVEDHGTAFARGQVGIYGACAKMAILMSMFVQAYRYAADPFFFSHEKEKDSRTTYATLMKYFVIICAVIFLGVVFFMDIFKFFVDREYWEGISVVPILLLAYICYGVFYNLAVWYKLGGQTKYGAYIPLIGAVVTIGLNLWFIPIYGYVGSAWATLAAYSTMMAISYFLGQKFYKIEYAVGRIGIYLIVAIVLYLLFNPIPAILEKVSGPNPDDSINWLQIAFSTAIILGYAGFVYVLERPKKSVN